MLALAVLVAAVAAATPRVVVHADVNGWVDPLPGQNGNSNWRTHGCDASGTYVSGRVHMGADYPAGVGTAVYAIGAGTAVRVGGNDTEDEVLQVRHQSADGTVFVANYGHINIATKFGGNGVKDIGVARGEVLGHVRPHSGGDHLHFGIYESASPNTTNWGTRACPLGASDGLHRAPGTFLRAHPGSHTLSASAVTVTMPEGNYQYRPIHYAYTVTNPSSSPINAMAFFLAFRDPYGSNYDHPCDNGINVTIPAGGSWACHTSGPNGYGSLGTYRIFPAWQNAPGSWPALGPEQTFTLVGPWAQLRLTGGPALSFPQGQHPNRPATITFTVTNQSGSSATAAPLTVAVRTPDNQNVDVPCGTVTLASWESHTCTASRPGGFPVTGTYTYWVDWLNGDGWHGAGQFGGMRTFALTTAPATPPPSNPPPATPPPGPAPLHAIAPTRLFDTRAGQPDGAVAVPKAPVAAGGTLRAKVAGAAGVPASGAVAVSLNVTAVGPDTAGYITVFPCGQMPVASNVNYLAGDTVPNAVIAPMSAAGEVCFYSSARTELVADVNGWFATEAGFTPVTPARLVDTRELTAQGAVQVPKRRYEGSSILRFHVTGAGGVPTGAAAVALNVTAVDAAGPGYLTVYPCGTRPTASNVNYADARAVPNAVIAPLSAAGEVCVYSKTAAHVIIDVNGWFAAGSGFTSVTPVRLVDTRPSQPAGAVAVAKQTYGGALELRFQVADVAGIPTTGVEAVSLNVTVTEPTEAGFLTVHPCGQRPNASNVNYAAGQTIPNAVLAPVSAGGELCIYSRAAAHLVVDVNGWFAS